jgi:hypothetical protein
MKLLSIVIGLCIALCPISYPDNEKDQYAQFHIAILKHQEPYMIRDANGNWSFSEKLLSDLASATRIYNEQHTTWVGHVVAANTDPYGVCKPGLLVESEIGFRDDGIVVWRKTK